MGASNDARELEGWIKAGTGDDKTDILVIADFYDRAAIYSPDRDISRNAWAIPWGGLDRARSTSEPGHIGGRFGSRLIPRLFFSANSPPPHSGGKSVRMKDGKEKNVLPVSTAEYNPCGWRS
jgi:hypothetical protein